MEAYLCTLQMRVARRINSTVTCIVVQNVRPAPEISFLVPGNLGFMHQFSLKKGIPQFCLTSDLNKTVSVANRTGKVVQRTLMMSARARIQAAPSRENDAVPHDGSAASPRVLGSAADVPGVKVVSLLLSPEGEGRVCDLTAGSPGCAYSTLCHPFATFLNGESANCSLSTVHEFVAHSLDTLFEPSVDHVTRMAICNKMLKELESNDDLPASPHLLSLKTLKTLQFGTHMSWDLVELFLLLFSQACCIESHK